MRLLQLPVYSYPETAASLYLADNRNQAFINAGFDIIAYSPTPCRGIDKELRKEYRNKRHKHETLYGGRMILNRFAMYAEGKNPLLRALRYSLCWVIQLWRGLRTKDIDCIYLASTPPIQGVLGGVLKNGKRFHLCTIFKTSSRIHGGNRIGAERWAYLEVRACD